MNIEYLYILLTILFILCFIYILHIHPFFNNDDDDDDDNNNLTNKK